MRKRNPHRGRAECEGLNPHSTARLDVYTVKGAIPPEDFYRYELPAMPAPKRGGWVDGGLCPFHADNHRGNFRVNTFTGAYKCFACDAKGGSVIDFRMEREGLSFRKALRQLAREWGVEHE